MIENLKKYREDLEKLEDEGSLLFNALQLQCFPEDFKKLYSKKLTGENYDKFLEMLPNFANSYQAWYSEAKSVIRQLLPERLDDFCRLYEKPRAARKEITHENYTIEDALIGLQVTRGWEKEVVVSAAAAVPRMQQHLHLLTSVKRRFESSLFDIKQLVQADVFDSEIDASKSLIKNGFVRAAGAVAGVVLEAHLKQVCENHKIVIRKKSPSIADFNDKLKAEDVIETPMWRKIQHLADVRNSCDHKKASEPTLEDVEEMITGVEKVIKNLF